eukprot:IDg1657t1
MYRGNRAPPAGPRGLGQESNTCKPSHRALARSDKRDSASAIRWAPESTIYLAQWLLDYSRMTFKRDTHAHGALGYYHATYKFRVRPSSKHPPALMGARTSASTLGNTRGGHTGAITHKQ